MYALTIYKNPYKWQTVYIYGQLELEQRTQRLREAGVFYTIATTTDIKE